MHAHLWVRSSQVLVSTGRSESALNEDNGYMNTNGHLLFIRWHLADAGSSLTLHLCWKECNQLAYFFKNSTPLCPVLLSSKIKRKHANCLTPTSAYRIQFLCSLFQIQGLNRPSCVHTSTHNQQCPPFCSHPFPSFLCYSSCNTGPQDRCFGPSSITPAWQQTAPAA